MKINSLLHISELLSSFTLSQALYCPCFRSLIHNRGDKNQVYDFTGKFPPPVLKFSVPGIHSRLTGSCHISYNLSELFSAGVIPPFQNLDQIMLLYTTECTIRQSWDHFNPAFFCVWTSPVFFLPAQFPWASPACYSSTNPDMKALHIPAGGTG